LWYFDAGVHQGCRRQVRFVGKAAESCTQAL
jgi:hypothetical protein